MNQKHKVYLDNSATTRPGDSVIEAMRESMAEQYYNPSSLYGPSLEVERLMDDCRGSIMSVLRSENGRVVFTSGGTEADNLAIIGGMANRQPGKVLYGAGEHPAVIESCKSLANRGFVVDEIPLDERGLISLEKLESMLTPDTRLICVMQINNETGAVQPLKEAVSLRDGICPEAFFHVDGVQGFLRHDCHVSDIGIDSYALSAHKIHGPKGIGALWINERMRLQPLLMGGGQEGTLRSGTENTPGIAGLFAAIKTYPKHRSMRGIKLSLYDMLQDAIAQMKLNGPDPRSPQSADHIINLSFPPVRAQTMLHALEGMGILVGNGSACSSRRQKSSHVLRAMKISPSAMESAIRFSFNPYLTKEDVDYTVDGLIKNYALLKRYTRR